MDAPTGLMMPANSEKQLSDEMLETEIEAARTYDEAVRDQHIALLLDMPIASGPGGKCATDSPGAAGTLVCWIDRSLARVVGVAGDQADDLAQALRNQPGLEDTAQSAAQQLVTAAATGKVGDSLPEVTCLTRNRDAMAMLDPMTDPRFSVLKSSEREGLKKILAAADAATAGART